MELFIQQFMWFTKLAVNYAQIFKVCPYRWEKESQTLKLLKPNLGLRTWKATVYLCLAHHLFLSVRLWQSSFGNQEGLVLYCCKVAYYVGFTISLIVQVSLLTYTTEFMYIANQALLYWKTINSKI